MFQSYFIRSAVTSTDAFLLNSHVRSTSTFHRLVRLCITSRLWTMNPVKTPRENDENEYLTQ